MLDLNWDAWTRDGTIDPGEFATVATTERFDHCVFTVRADLTAHTERRWLEALFAMRYDDPAHREMMDLEGLKAWMPGPLSAAVDAERFFDRVQSRV
jgi:ABC-type phosphate/phosphonate transport system substrate-binding protein